MGRDAPQSDVLSLMRTYESPPKGFDPHAAPPEQLQHHGLPRRPDPEREPNLASLWQWAFARPVVFVEAELAIDPVRTGRDPRPGKDPEFGPSGWAGVVREMHPEHSRRPHRPGRNAYDYSKPATMVFAKWVVPEVDMIHIADENLNVGFWVGLDGWGSGQLLQAGTAANLSKGSLFSSGTLSFYAWTEWWTEEHHDPAVQVTNFPVAPGDTVFFSVCAPQPDFGFVSMLNLSRNQGTSVGINARSNIKSSGRSVEWIVEAPPQSPGLPMFAPMTFSGCSAGSMHELFNLEPDGVVTNITAPNPSIDGPGYAITQTYIVSPTIAVVDWKGFGESPILP
jgi:hypothetical protein